MKWAGTGFMNWRRGSFLYILCSKTSFTEVLYYILAAFFIFGTCLIFDCKMQDIKLLFLLICLPRNHYHNRMRSGIEPLKPDNKGIITASYISMPTRQRDVSDDKQRSLDCLSLC
jgi:hypothetical protein